MNNYKPQKIMGCNYSFAPWSQGNYVIVAPATMCQKNWHITLHWAGRTEGAPQSELSCIWHKSVSTLRDRNPHWTKMTWKFASWSSKFRANIGLAYLDPRPKDDCPIFDVGLCLSHFVSQAISILEVDLLVIYPLLLPPHDAIVALFLKMFVHSYKVKLKLSCAEHGF